MILFFKTHIMPVPEVFHPGCFPADNIRPYIRMKSPCNLEQVTKRSFMPNPFNHNIHKSGNMSMIKINITLKLY
jgi:hypothetical protein